MISPRSSLNSGFSPSAVALACIALPRFSVVIPVWSWKAMNDSISGDVRTPPKSEITASIRSAIAPHHLVVAEALTALQRPAEERDLGGEARAADRAGADQGAAAAQRLALLAVDPELERRPCAGPRPVRTRSRAGPRKPRPERRRGRRGRLRGPRRRGWRRPPAAAPRERAGRRRRRRSRSTVAGSVAPHSRARRLS